MHCRAQPLLRPTVWMKSTSPHTQSPYACSLISPIDSLCDPYLSVWVVQFVQQANAEMEELFGSVSQPSNTSAPPLNPTQSPQPPFTAHMGPPATSPPSSSSVAQPVLVTDPQSTAVHHYHYHFHYHYTMPSTATPPPHPLPLQSPPHNAMQQPSSGNARVDTVGTVR